MKRVLIVKGDLLRWYLEMGCDELYSSLPINCTASATSVTTSHQLSTELVADNENHIEQGMKLIENEASRKLADACKTLAELRGAVESFEGCELKKVAINTVFGVGNPKAELMLIGEAPGANEDKEGIPFCGQSGKLLDNILLAAGFKREEVYITNSVFWRPPGNRRPTPEEVGMCRPFVEKHIALIKPKMILMVGSTAVESLTGEGAGMHGLREKTFDYTNQYLDNPIPAIVIFHPAYLLRQPMKKKLMWFDMLKVKERIGALRG
jgi:DNA polymerase